MLLLLPLRLLLLHLLLLLGWLGRQPSKAACAVWRGAWQRGVAWSVHAWTLISSGAVGLSCQRARMHGTPGSRNVGLVVSTGALLA